jgi:molybdopterin-binding protein
VVWNPLDKPKSAGATNANQCTKSAEGHREEVEQGAVNAEVTRAFGWSRNRLDRHQTVFRAKLSAGKVVHAVIKASDVMDRHRLEQMD